MQACVYVFVTVYMWVLAGEETANTQETVQELQEHKAGIGIIVYPLRGLQKGVQLCTYIANYVSDHQVSLKEEFVILPIYVVL